jgi:hypothetical protein
MAVGLLFLGQVRLRQAISEQSVIIVTRLLACSRRILNGKKNENEKY